ncbi:MAG TPA: xanthine permease XanP, partial [Lentisphaeria bacterium]|nr:xanthine permease XanP [Lentisphaeria bacterium]
WVIFDAYTGVASRHVGFFIAGLLLLAGIFPVIANTFQVIPQSVLGGGMLIMFGTIMTAGIRILGMENLNRRSLIIVSVAIAAGMTVEDHTVLKHFPDIIKYLFSSGIGTGGLAAILLNLFLPRNKKKVKVHTIQES